MFKLHKFMKGETTVQAALIIKLVIKLFFLSASFTWGWNILTSSQHWRARWGSAEHWLVCLLSRCTRNSLTYSFHGVCCCFQRANFKAEHIHCTWLCSESRLKSCPPVSGFSFLSLCLQCLGIARQLLPPSVSSEDLWLAGAVSVSAAHRWMLRNKGI